MSLHSYSVRGIILAKRNFGEADRIYDILTDKFGKESFMAKGVRRPSSRKRGHLEVFNLVKLMAVKQKGMDLLTEAEIIDSYSGLRKNLNKISLAYYYVEVVNKIISESEAHPELFDFLINYLKNLETATNLKSVRKRFVKEILIGLGYWPTNTKLDNPDGKLEEVLERQLTSVRIGKKLLL